MRGPWASALIDRLVSSKSADGGWGYASSRVAAAEPSAWASLALSAHGVDVVDYLPGLGFLARIQRSTGAVPAVANVESPGWTTGPAVLAWTHAATELSVRHEEAARRGAEWLLQQAGERAPSNPTIYGHDTSLIGWPWVHGTHSWVEPTAYALLALDATRHRDHPRCVEGRRLLRNRVIPGGGWNYGNARMFGAALRPFPETTGVALLALSGFPGDKATESSLDYLLGELPRVRSPMSVSWGVMALTTWGRRPVQADDWLAQTAQRFSTGEFDPLQAALLLLADLDSCPLISGPRLAEVRHG